MGWRFPGMPPRSAFNFLFAIQALVAVGMTVAAPAQEPAAAPEPGPVLTIAEFQKTSAQWVKTPARVRGTVTGFWGNAFFLEGQSGAMFVFNDLRKGNLRIGDAVEITGPAVTGGATAHLQLQDVLVLGPGSLPETKVITVAEALGGQFDARLVRMSGRVATEHTPFGPGQSVLLDADGTRFSAEFTGEPDGLAWPKLLPGQLVETSGILSVRGARDTNPMPFRILIRSHRDVTVLGPQPWWMPPRLYRTAGTGLLILGAGFAWSRIVRRNIRAQTRKIRARLESESAVEQRYRELFENATDLILTYDLAGKITSFNPAGERLLGWRASEITGRDISVLLVREERETSGGITAPASALERDNGVVFELDLLARDGRRVPVEISSWTEFQDGQPVGRQAICRDLTGRHRDQEERANLDRKLQESQKLESLGVLAGGVAHDFNNLLTSILGNASLAQMDSPADSPAQPCLHQIEIAAERAAGLCQQMLAYSGQGRFVVKRADLSALVRENTEFLRASVNRKAALNLRLAEALPATIADVTQMRQMLMNLVVNAGEALGDNAGTITITTGTVQAAREDFAASHLSPDLLDGEYVFLEISDNGCGMDADTRSKIFDPFFSTKFTGRGLGLAAVLGIVRGHRGAISVNTQAGTGTTFRVLLPSTGTPSLQTEFPFSPASRSAGRILLVDDEEPIRTATRRMLENFGYEVLTAGDGLAAVEQVRLAGTRLSAVVLDLTMPQMDGADAFREMRLLQPDLRVLLMSGFAEQQAIARFAGQGLTGFLQKPFKPDVLREKLAAVLSTPAPV
jgi:PAS domain S-box-containing protein